MIDSPDHRLRPLEQDGAPIWKRAPRAVYLHIPFCRRRCGYCNFTLVAGRNDLIAPYLAALVVEGQMYDLPCPVDTIFIGGGTPSQLQGAQLKQFAEWVRQQFPLAEGGEWTVEVNPEDTSERYFHDLREAGVTRVSMGVQSFFEPKLKTLEREHTGRQAIKSVIGALDIFESVGVDLIFAAPGESEEEWREDLSTALSLGVQHISTYGLTYERGAAFWSRRQQGTLCAISEDRELTMYKTAIDLLTEGGLEHYEVSNFARPEFHCRHNEFYWTGATYHALGAGAARHLDGRRETNHRSTTQYLRRLQNGKSPVEEVDEASDKEKAVDTLIFGLRQLAGVNRDWFQRQTGYELHDVIGDLLAEYCEQGWLDDDGERVRLSSKGLMVSDSLWTDMLRRVPGNARC
jgi:oxygen-independent coproporphyrinogen-3 oxidase